MNYEEKITINVTERLYNRITDDIRVYGKLKNNGEPNINEFLNTVISNYFDEYSDSYSDMIDRIAQVVGEDEKGSRRKAQEIVIDEHAKGYSSETENKQAHRGQTDEVFF